MKKNIIICGGGAAGFFAAVNIAEKHPEYQVTILEKSNKILSKVRISGGGRCNVSNARSKPSELVKTGLSDIYNFLPHIKIETKFFYCGRNCISFGSLQEIISG